MKQTNHPVDPNNRLVRRQRPERAVLLLACLLLLLGCQEQAGTPAPTAAKSAVKSHVP